MGITYIPMARGFVCLAAVVDWFSRKALAWKLSITLPVDCLATRRWRRRSDAMKGPGILNADQGSQLASVSSSTSQ